MRDEKEKIHARLVADSTLLALLASNKPFYNLASGTAATANSIIPAGKATGETITPFVTIQIGSTTQLGNKMYDMFIYVRAYGSIKKAYVKIQQILERVQVLIHDYEFSLDSTLVQAKYESTLPEMVDESLGLNYQESRFRLLLL